MILIILGIICLIILIVMKVKDKNNDKISKKLKMWTNILFVCVIVLIVYIILGNKITGLNSMFTIIQYIASGIGLIALIVSTIISIKNKEKLQLWVSLVQAIVIVAIVGSCITAIINGNRDRQVQENIKQYTEQYK